MSIVFCFESQHVGERPTEVGVFLQDMVPSTGVDAFCGVHVPSVEFLFHLVHGKTQGLSCSFQCLSWMMQPSSTAHRTRILGSKRHKTNIIIISAVQVLENHSDAFSVMSFLRGGVSTLLCTEGYNAFHFVMVSESSLSTQRQGLDDFDESSSSACMDATRPDGFLVLVFVAL